MKKVLTPGDFLFGINFYLIDLSHRMRSNETLSELGDMTGQYALFRTEFEELDSLLYVAEMLDLSTWVRKRHEGLFEEIANLQDKYGFFYIDTNGYGNAENAFRDIQLEDMSDPMDDSYYDKLADQLQYGNTDTPLSYVIWKLGQIVGLDFYE